MKKKMVVITAVVCILLISVTVAVWSTQLTLNATMEIQQKVIVEEGGCDESDQSVDLLYSDCD